MNPNGRRPAEKHNMDDRDRELLNKAQREFPLEQRPFAHLAQELDMSEQEVMQRLHRLKQEKIIRRIGAVFDSQALGYTSCLVAAKVDINHLENVAEKINQLPGVTHNYQRSHEYNLWFTLTTSNQTVLDELIKKINALPGVQALHPLPASKVFQRQVTFHL
jgi:DNA-binding Lrp family transcriptional regulator